MAKQPVQAAGASVPSIAKSGDTPDYLLKLQTEGASVTKDNFDSSDVAVPRVKLLQGTSPECEAFDDAKAGRFWHTGMDVSLGDTFTFIVCARRKKLLLQAPLEDGQGILARAEDCMTWDKTGRWEVKLKDRKDKVVWEIKDLDVGKSGMDAWGSSDPEDADSPPAATLFYDYLIVLPDMPDAGPAVMSLARSQIRKAKRGLNDKIAMHTGAGRPMQAVIFAATSVNDKNSNNQDYKNWSFGGAGYAEQAQYEAAMGVYETLADTFRVADEDTVANDENEGAGSTDSKDF